MSWPDSGTALHALTIDRWRLTEDLWRELGEQLRRLGQEGQPTVTFTPVTFTPVGRAVVTSSPSAMGRSVVTVTAPDQVGVLWAICRWFADHDVSIEAASVGASDGQVEDHFVVVGQPDTRALAARLSEPGGSLMSAAVGVAKGVVRRLVPS
jgi:UTP:GlnB (protein PII) uridylyltransferase